MLKESVSSPISSFEEDSIEISTSPSANVFETSTSFFNGFVITLLTKKPTKTNNKISNTVVAMEIYNIVLFFIAKTSSYFCPAKITPIV